MSATRARRTQSGHTCVFKVVLTGGIVQASPVQMRWSSFVEWRVWLSTSGAGHGRVSALGAALPGIVKAYRSAVCSLGAAVLAAWGELCRACLKQSTLPSARELCQCTLHSDKSESASALSLPCGRNTLTKNGAGRGALKPKVLSIHRCSGCSGGAIFCATPSFELEVATVCGHFGAACARLAKGFGLSQRCGH